MQLEVRESGLFTKVRCSTRVRMYMSAKLMYAKGLARQDLSCTHLAQPELESVLMMIISLLLLCNAQRPVSLTDDLALRQFAHNQAESGENTSNANYLEIACMDQDQKRL